MVRRRPGFACQDYLPSQWNPAFRHVHLWGKAARVCCGSGCDKRQKRQQGEVELSKMEEEIKEKLLQLSNNKQLN